MKLLFIGDIVGEPGRHVIREAVPRIKKRESIDVVVANCENAAGGSGLTPEIADELFRYGVNILTSGDHIWKRKEIVDVLDVNPYILRPLNYPPNVPGNGSCVYKTEDGLQIGVINLVGRVFMEAVDCPFRGGMAEVEKLRKRTQIILVDIHAEATSEKIALSYYLDGLVSAICGTHTHVPTADEKVTANGTAYITDVGMTGPHKSVIGRKPEQIITRFITQLPTRFQMAEEDLRLQGAIIDIDEKTGKANSIKRVEEKVG
ncbi:MAG: TIGR00282 family metallophosphoesterase [Candidatus Omnitrophica bacterium CG07_land_8_20_14_0_80_42_15]|uniref:TIGR00282 family metallophosphoesterase n=1 Tax=Candidatus Aquitaenariimonas noxiae TaxID=1974741 RepID=A0A2J0KUH1_9BACT|nr:MAG: TIGR00282 family metallophosphoesterase [Candidatus Omnitrophica bacterium CG07_land_8_20_14_0_80_42_15]